MKTDRLLLVSANTHSVPYPVYPLGISYLQAYLKEQRPDMEIRIFDCMRGDYGDYVRVLGEFRPDVTGISLRNIDDVNIYKKESFIGHYRHLVSLTRDHSRSLVVIGGSGFSIYPELLFDTLQPDFGIYGEGETGLQRLLAALEKGGDYRQIEALVYREDGITRVNPRSSFLRTPMLQFDGEMADWYWDRSGMLNIQTKRGCPYKCIYCTYPLIEGSEVRTLDADRVTESLAELYFNKKIDYVFFTDSVFNISNGFNLKLADNLIREKIHIRWGGYFNFARLDKNLLARLRESGLTHIEFGTESLSDTMLKHYNKPFTVNDILQASQWCNELGIDFAHFLILGGYGETNETLEEGFENAGKIRRSVFFPFIGVRIYPGTRMQQLAIGEKVIASGDPLLEPVYYVSPHIDIGSLKERALKTGRRWIFPDDDLSEVMNRMRKRNKKGPLWEYLIR